VTRKDIPHGFIKGISEKIGMSFDMIKKVYDDTYKYKEDRCIKSYHVHETHNNVGLEGDVFQEVNVFIHMLSKRLRNPFLQGRYAFSSGVSPVQPMVDVICNQAALSTLKQTIRVTSNIVLDDDKLNNSQSKQLEHYASDGISIKGVSEGVAKMRCKSLSGSATKVDIELPEISAEKFRLLPADKRDEIEYKLELAVTAIVLHNSTSSKSMNSSVKSLINQIVSSDDVVAALHDLQGSLGKMVPTQKEDALKASMKQFVNAITGVSPLKTPVNTHIGIADLDNVEKALSQGIEFLASSQQFKSHIPMSDVSAAILKMKGEFVGMQMAIKEGVNISEVPIYGELDKYAKSAQTRMLKHRENTLQAHVDASPDLSLNITTTKKDPLGFMLQSPLARLLMKSEIEVPSMDVKNNLDFVRRIKR
jgi:hypothetical protein